MISRMRASMRSRSSGVNVRAVRAARSRSRSRPRPAGRWRTWRRGTGRAPPGRARGPSSGGSCRGPGRVVSVTIATVVAVGERPDEVALDAVDLGDHRGLGQPRADRPRPDRRRWCPAAAACAEPSGSVIVIWSVIGSRSYRAASRRHRPGQRRCTAARRRAPSTSAERAPWRSARSWPFAGRTVAVVGRSVAMLRRLGRERLGLLGGVRVDVLLARQLADLVHDLVGDLAQHAGGRRPRSRVAVDVDRPADADARPAGTSFGQLRVRAACTSTRALHADRDDRRARCAGRGGPTPVWPLCSLPSRRPGALGVDAEQLALLEHACARRRARRWLALPPERSIGIMPEGREEVLRLPVSMYSALPT